MLFGILFIGLVLLFVTSLTGGFAGAIVAGGREDRSLLANARIGLVGWGVAWVIWRIFAGRWPEEVSLGLGLLALLISIAFVRSMEKQRAKEAEGTEHTLTV
jgi:hypothetical protein